MSFTLHRIAKLKYASLPAPTEHGYGAARYGGRWNSADPDLRANRRLIYASDTLAQAMLEVIVHADPGVLHSVAHGRVSFQVEEESLQELSAELLPARWNDQPLSRDSQIVGDEWCDTQASVVLRVPSVILPLSVYPDKHSNYLINTRHPDFERAVRLLGYEALPFDPRLP